LDTSVSEDRTDSIFRIEVRATMEAAQSSEMLVSNHHTTRRNNLGKHEFYLESQIEPT